MDLIADGVEHQLSIDLSPKMKTPQADQLIFTLPTGVTLRIEHLMFVTDQQRLPCAAWASVGPKISSNTLPLRGIRRKA
jgi:hypothetical protein